MYSLEVEVEGAVDRGCRGGRRVLHQGQREVHYPCRRPGHYDPFSISRPVLQTPGHHFRGTVSYRRRLGRTSVRDERTLRRTRHFRHHVAISCVREGVNFPGYCPIVGSVQFNSEDISERKRGNIR